MRRSSLFALLPLCAACASVTPVDPDASPDGAALDADSASPTDAFVPIDGTFITDADPPAVRPTLANDITVSEVAVFQGVRVAVFSNNDVIAPAMRNAPLVSGRDTVVRVYVTPKPGFRPRTLTAQVDWYFARGAWNGYYDTRMITAASSDATAASVFTIAIPREVVTREMQLRVRIVDDAGSTIADGVPHDGRAPRDGTFAPLAASSAPDAVRVTLVPVRWTGDGSNRLPDTTPAQLERFRALLVALYPVTRVEFTVHEPLSFGTTTFTGNVNFGALNSQLESMRDRENPGDDVYYYALVSPDVSRAAYCGRSCVTGQSYVVADIADANIRVGSGVGFTGDDTAWTFAHELGHLFGRYHAPCSTSGADSNYPYRNAQLGVWGWDARSNSFFAPADTTDFMGYCDPQWVSDYTYAALYTRASTLRPGPMALSDPSRNPLVHVVSVRSDHTLVYSHARHPKSLPRGSRALDVRYLDARGRELGRAWAPFVAIADGEPTIEGNVFVPDAYPTATRVLVRDGNAAAMSLTLPPR